MNKMRNDTLHILRKCNNTQYWIEVIIIKCINILKLKPQNITAIIVIILLAKNQKAINTQFLKVQLCTELNIPCFLSVIYVCKDSPYLSHDFQIDSDKP